MSLTAVWTILTPEAENSGGEMVVRTSDDVDALIMALSQPGSTAALVQHQDRPTVYDEDLGDIPDHDVTIGIWRGFGYLSFADLEHEFMYSDGESDSPSFAGHYTEYPAGSGVNLATLRAALVEFLETAQRPTNIHWKEDS
ncbi:hypothetical protein GCM10027280_60050 [Micromonospora polyrhachis]|uniref:Immunity protein Imm1 n=1 Tax=Micromonospora polyrhachis TaxID=1282883 RepID=A0A7W7SN89_9ACTN|nr:Imm1 family immunity protein [Micromonospora polyrhachis]MBB4957895.1 hypothetical protein [Micromonospora polyrhachis]